MSAQQIKLTINDLMNGIEDEDKLQACYLVLTTIANNDNQPKSKAVKPRLPKKNKATPSRTEGDEQATVSHQDNVQPHDLSLVLLANDLFKGSQPLSEAAILAFDDVLKASALKIPTLPNRL